MCSWTVISLGCAMTEKNAIAKAVQHYISGAKSGSSAEMRRAFHADATIFGYEGDSLFAGPIQRLFDWNDQNGPAEDLKANIVNIEDRKSTRLNSSHQIISYAVFCLKKKNKTNTSTIEH